MSRPLLIGSVPSSSTRRVAIALRLKGVAFDFKRIDLAAGEHQSQEFLETVNPLGQVPVLVHDGHKIPQSIAALEYLDEVFVTPPLFPAEALGRARCREVVQVVNSGIQPMQNRGLIKKIAEDYGDPELAAFIGGTGQLAAGSWPHFWIDKGLSALETCIKQHGGIYCFGDAVTLADVVLFPQLETAQHYGVDLARYPGLLGVQARLREIEAFGDHAP